MLSDNLWLDLCVRLWGLARTSGVVTAGRQRLALSRDLVVSNVEALYVPGNFNALANFASWAAQFFVSVCHQISITPQNCSSKPCSVDLVQPTQISPTLSMFDKTCDHQNKTPIEYSHTLALTNGNLGFKECASRAALRTSLGREEWFILLLKDCVGIYRQRMNQDHFSEKSESHLSLIYETFI